MTYTYNTGVPAAANNPSTDQPDMLTNAQSINSIIGVDHVSFNAASGGTHLQVTLSSKNAAGAQTDPASTIYTGSGTASSIANLLYRNQNAVFPLSCVRAWAVASSAGIVSSQSVNVTSVTRTSAGNYTVTMPANTVASTAYGVLISSYAQSAGALTTSSYAITGATTFTISFVYTAAGGQYDPTNFTFLVVQL